jgi:nucleotide sugar dehydrogenase
MKKPLIGFIGQGFIGKNYADDFERRKYKVVRYALESQYIKNKEIIKSCDITFIAVPTPTTPKGFDAKIVDEALSLIGDGKIAVIKSTIIPGTTKLLQKKYSKIIVLHSPEFLSENTATIDAAQPFSNIIGFPVESEKHKKAANEVLKVLPKAPFSLICSSNESEIIKYAHNCNGFFQIIFFNMIYDLAKKFSADWSNIQKAIKADVFMNDKYANPVHKNGRGAGGHCFIKDFAAFANVYKQNIINDNAGLSVLKNMELKNIELLKSTKKDLDLLSGVYGKKIFKKNK